MKIEYLYIDDSYKDCIKDISVLDSVKLSESKKEESFIFSYETSSNSEEDAKMLSFLNKKLLSVLDTKKCFVLTNEAAAYYNNRLFPLINKFERLLRKALCCVAVKKKDNSAIELSRKIEELDFGSIYGKLFVCENFVTSAKAIINNKSGALAKADLIEKIEKLPENTLWNSLFGGKYTVISSSFQKIKEYRNSVMHAHNVQFEDYIDAKKLIKTAIKELCDIINEYLNEVVEIDDRLYSKLDEVVSQSKYSVGSLNPDLLTIEQKSKLNELYIKLLGLDDKYVFTYDLIKELSNC